jgi:hypothetical protein
MKRLTTCAWMETSSADTGSSIFDAFEREIARPSD